LAFWQLSFYRTVHRTLRMEMYNANCLRLYIFLYMWSVNSIYLNVSNSKNKHFIFVLFIRRTSFRMSPDGFEICLNKIMSLVGKSSAQLITRKCIILYFLWSRKICLVKWSVHWKSCCDVNIVDKFGYFIPKL